MINGISFPSARLISSVTVIEGLISCRVHILQFSWKITSCCLKSRKCPGTLPVSLSIIFLNELSAMLEVIHFLKIDI